MTLSLIDGFAFSKAADHSCHGSLFVPGTTPLSVVKTVTVWEPCDEPLAPLPLHALTPATRAATEPAAASAFQALTRRGDVGEVLL
jgi:hypothetical protein